MASPIDGGFVGEGTLEKTWGSLFGYLRWIKYSQPTTENPFQQFLGYAEATGPDGSLMITGRNYVWGSQPTFGFGSGILDSSAGRDGWINKDYHSEFLGKSLTPAGQSWGVFVRYDGITIKPRGPISMSSLLINDDVGATQPVDNPTEPDTIWYTGVEGIEGFVDQT